MQLVVWDYVRQKKKSSSDFNIILFDAGKNYKITNFWVVYRFKQGKNFPQKHKGRKALLTR